MNFLGIGIELGGSVEDLFKNKPEMLEAIKTLRKAVVK